MKVFAEELVAFVFTALCTGIMILAAAVWCDIISFGV